MKERVTYINKRFAHLKVIGEKKQPRGNYHRKMLVRCDCGKQKYFWLNNLRSGRTTHCGCRYKWNSTMAIRRIERAIQHEINQFVRYEGSMDDYKTIALWIKNRGEELGTFKQWGDGTMDIIESCNGKGA